MPSASPPQEPAASPARPPGKFQQEMAARHAKVKADAEAAQTELLQMISGSTQEIDPAAMAEVNSRVEFLLKLEKQISKAQQLDSARPHHRSSQPPQQPSQQPFPPPGNHHPPQQQPQQQQEAPYGAVATATAATSTSPQSQQQLVSRLIQNPLAPPRPVLTKGQQAARNRVRGYKATERAYRVPGRSYAMFPKPVPELGLEEPSDELQSSEQDPEFAVVRERKVSLGLKHELEPIEDLEERVLQRLQNQKVELAARNNQRGIRNYQGWSRAP